MWPLRVVVRTCRAACRTNAARHVVVFLRVDLAARRAGDDQRVALAGRSRRRHDQRKAATQTEQRRRHVIAAVDRERAFQTRVRSSQPPAAAQDPLRRQQQRTTARTPTARARDRGAPGAAFCGTASCSHDDDASRRRRRGRSGRRSRARRAAEILRSAADRRTRGRRRRHTSSDRRRRAASRRAAPRRGRGTARPDPGLLNGRRDEAAAGRIARGAASAAASRRRGASASPSTVASATGANAASRASTSIDDRIARLGRVGHARSPPDRARPATASAPPAARRTRDCDRSRRPSSSSATTLRPRRPSTVPGRSAARRPPETRRRPAPMRQRQHGGAGTRRRRAARSRRAPAAPPTVLRVSSGDAPIRMIGWASPSRVSTTPVVPAPQIADRATRARAAAPIVELHRQHFFERRARQAALRERSAAEHQQAAAALGDEVGGHRQLRAREEIAFDVGDDERVVGVQIFAARRKSARQRRGAAAAGLDEETCPGRRRSCPCASPSRSRGPDRPPSARVMKLCSNPGAPSITQQPALAAGGADEHAAAVVLGDRLAHRRRGISAV